MYFLNVSFSDICEQELLSVVASPDLKTFQYMVTPNADHLVRLAKDSSFAAAYDLADYIVCDSKVVYFLSIVFGYKIKQVITGSDFTKKLIDSSDGGEHGLSDLIIVGGCEGDIRKLHKEYVNLNIRHYNPPMGFISDEGEVESCIDFLANVGSGTVLLCVGSPQQEILAKRIKEDGRFKGFACCVGASIDFMVGRASRAPSILQALGLEWAFRLCMEPRRLWRRYLRACLIILVLSDFLIKQAKR